MVWYISDVFETFFQDPPNTRGFKYNGKPRNPMKFPAPVQVDANGVYHGLEFDNAGTNATRIYLAAQFLESDWVNTIEGDKYDSYASDGDFFAILAGKLAALEPCLHNVTGEALFWMYDQIIVKYGQVHSMLASGRGGGDMETTKLMKFAEELYYLDESFLEAKLKTGSRLEASERKRAEKISKRYPMTMMDSGRGFYKVPAFGGHWPPREGQAAPAPRQRQAQGQAQGQAQRARQGQEQAQGQGRVGGGGRDVVAAAAEGRRQVAAVATTHAAAAVASSGPAPIRTAPATPVRDVGPVRNVGVGTRTAPIFIDDFDDGEGEVVALPASARAAARANAARPY
ncbi:hypothetical protein KI688_005006 [Linnemannia hyalina]|uniref:Uncharacterized protein n=1 Tax=Linnemannia hyalina TaxID=64524 RepID=A0A9P7XJV1_9FUNG|nr:hypothetical protein KI688_005006 [Linnemannia hyalina]